MLSNVRVVSIVFLFSLSVIIPSQAHADAPLGARAVHVKGEVHRISAKDNAVYTISVGDPLAQGDRITTGAQSSLEIEFDTGATLLLDSNTDFIIKTLGKSRQGTVTAMFELAVGMIKSTFSKLAADDSVEYHTRTAITGIAGTPPHIIKVDATDKGVARTNVYLLGKKADKGALFARGFDPAKTEVKLLAGHGTTILAGLAPTAPFVLTPIILKSLEGLIFHTGGAATAGGAGSTGAGVSVGTVAAVGGGAAVVAVAAGGSGGGGGDSGGGTTTPTGPTTPTTPTAPDTNDMTGKWGGTWITTSADFLPEFCVGETGTWSANFIQSGDNLSGSWSSSTGESGSLNGTRSGSSVTWSVGGGGSGSSFSGQVSGTSISGTWHEEDIDCGGIDGTLSGSKQ